MNHHFWALKTLEFNFQPLFLILNQQIFISSTFPSKNSHKFHFHNHKFHIFEFLHWWIVKGVSFCSYLEFGGLKWLETSFTPEKGNYLHDFRQFSDLCRDSRLFSMSTALCRPTMQSTCQHTCQFCNWPNSFFLKRRLSQQSSSLSLTTKTKISVDFPKRLRKRG